MGIHHCSCNPCAGKYVMTKVVEAAAFSEHRYEDSFLKYAEIHREVRIAIKYFQFYRDTG
jgi:hypothetical protein